ncbi:hypothetical protein GUITHDRAFT_147779 [Guillardia theta CCMP2712]|uniref:Uncharacterized protein n=1 Tax=Guillardia theta (strain CCMP2712) TaxID=905079 RepID=L1IBM3_GUITC|nr:hypothetical protein GUITHDRAFT_147779 [Guillardia theta CCMP2712]EKX33656.1 hypothetical protein GUITHDRAFT_147779 [Guillardia theta CCMP2712]|eukprot:XP_005820636.1 hypothetical protein GUITHDRAFT_147779 [Guillardia theta CCMP2712]
MPGSKHSTEPVAFRIKKLPVPPLGTPPRGFVAHAITLTRYDEIDRTISPENLKKDVPNLGSHPTFTLSARKDGASTDRNTPFTIQVTQLYSAVTWLNSNSTN